MSITMPLPLHAAHQEFRVEFARRVDRKHRVRVHRDEGKVLNEPVHTGGWSRDVKNNRGKGPRECDRCERQRGLS